MQPGRHRVLVVEDDDDQRQTIAAILRDAGFDVAEASDGATALQECERRDPDVIVLDLRLPGMDGAMFASMYRGRRGAAARILVLSARNDGAETSARVRADAYVSKPFELDVIVGRVRELAAAKRSGNLR